MLVDMVKRLANLKSELKRSFPRKTPAILEGFLERRTVDLLHPQVRDLAKTTHREKSDDVCVPELLKNLGLALKSGANYALRLAQIATNDLHGRGASGLFVGAPVHHRGTSGTEDRLNPERPEFLADRGVILAGSCFPSSIHG
jgi:hypothetical protein